MDIVFTVFKSLIQLTIDPLTQNIIRRQINNNSNYSFQYCFDVELGCEYKLVTTSFIRPRLLCDCLWKWMKNQNRPSLLVASSNLSSDFKKRTCGMNIKTWIWIKIITIIYVTSFGSFLVVNWFKFHCLYERIMCSSLLNTFGSGLFGMPVFSAKQHGFIAHTLKGVFIQ